MEPRSADQPDARQDDLIRLLSTKYNLACQLVEIIQSRMDDCAKLNTTAAYPQWYESTRLIADELARAVNAARDAGLELAAAREQADAQKD